MKKQIIVILFLIFTSLQFTSVFAQQRFPKPEFESGHTQPPTLKPEARAPILEYLDIVVLLVSLSLVTWLVLKKRSRIGVLLMSIFSIAYFGFFREGCVCSVGSLQNIVLAIFNPGYHIPISVLVFFAVPLLFSLFYGRTFCAAVCPLGAIQDFFLLRPVSMKAWVQSVLGVIPYIYLGLSILYAATSTDFVICRYDPFIGIFRLNATFMMFVLGGAFLLISMFIGRPYCRFLCPYGVLLNLTSRLSKKHLTITPAACIQCRLCEDSCPFGAINKPVPAKVAEDRKTIIRRYSWMIILIPVLMFIGGWTVASFHETLAKVNPKVRLASIIHENPTILDEDTSIDIDAFRSSGKTRAELFTEAADIVSDFYLGGWISGAFLGLVFGLTLTKLTIIRYRIDYTPNKGTCFSCARCVDYCPVVKDKIEIKTLKI
ncbi:MAG: 4Fe-4S ferredoxin [Bacteroidetes bacterium HGW-Bacteroidetes-17]|jgi:ferredoxin|nr:MAG: 4Fe-4S ferredoxin [Bacteroidetes bacterium HGW-Bacteroidetes-17]